MNPHHVKESKALDDYKPNKITERDNDGWKKIQWLFKEVAV